MTWLKAAKLLWTKIPEAAAPLAKPTQSFRQLKPNQYLTNKEQVIVGRVTIEPGQLWQVTYVDSLGAVVQNPPPSPQSEQGELFPPALKPVRITITNPDWKTTWARARKPRAKSKT